MSTSLTRYNVCETLTGIFCSTVGSQANADINAIDVKNITENIPQIPKKFQQIGTQLN